MYCIRGGVSVEPKHEGGTSATSWMKKGDGMAQAHHVNVVMATIMSRKSCPSFSLESPRAAYVYNFLNLFALVSESSTEGGTICKSLDIFLERV